MKPFSQRIQQASPQFFATLNTRIAALQKSGRDLIRLDIGSPDMPPAPHIIAALARAAAAPENHSYQDHKGPAGLRAAWAAMYRRDYNVELDPDREILPLLGTKEGIFHMSLAALNPGDIALIPDPAYVTYIHGASFAGAEPYYMPLLPENNYLPDLSAIPPDIARRARILWLNYPNNPTAATAPLEFFAQAVDYARKYELLLCHDSAYAQVTFEGYKAPSILEIAGAKEVAVEFNSLSKTYNMAGWRVGALAGNAQAVRALYTLKTNADSSHFFPILEGATAAMLGDQTWLEERNAIYQHRRDLVLAGLQASGLHPAAPRASLYVWSPVLPGYSSTDFAAELLDKAGVSVTPGVIFGERGEGYMRISLTTATGRIAEAMQRLAEARIAHPA
jgi:LL-diaminopimelate aminotransferase